MNIVFHLFIKFKKKFFEHFKQKSKFLKHAENFLKVSSNLLARKDLLGKKR
jgi:hypothetical protein